MSKRTSRVPSPFLRIFSGGVRSYGPRMVLFAAGCAILAFFAGGSYVLSHIVPADQKSSTAPAEQDIDQTSEPDASPAVPARTPATPEAAPSTATNAAGQPVSAASDADSASSGTAAVPVQPTDKQSSLTQPVTNAVNSLNGLLGGL